MTATQAAAKPQNFDTWKTVTLGKCKSGGEYCKAIRSANSNICELTNHVLNPPSFQRPLKCATEEIDVDLVVVSVAELGFKERAMYSAICARALELGLELCPAEVGPALRIAYKDKPRFEWLTIAMNDFLDPDTRAFLVFDLFCAHDVLWLRAHYEPPGHFLSSEDRFVFMRPRT